MTRIRFRMEEKYTLTGEGLIHEPPDALLQMDPCEIVEVLQPRFDEDWMAEAYASAFWEEPGVAVFVHEIVDAVHYEASENQTRLLEDAQ